MRRKLTFAALMGIILVWAAFLRLPDLANRPMHGDEGVNALKFGSLWNAHAFIYDPDNYHGPSLYYFTLPSAWLSHSANWLDFDEVAFRLVPVFFGLALIALTGLIASGVGRAAALVAAMFTAVSPAFVFYSRYYIHEMPLVCFSFAAIACGWRFSQTGRCGWAALLGVSLGLMHITKETDIIAMFAMVSGLGCSLAWGRTVHKEPIRLRHHFRRGAVASLLIPFLVITVLFFSAFFKNWPGLWDSITTYSKYLGHARLGPHDHPLLWYFHILLFQTGFPPRYIFIGEGLIIGLSFLGFLFALLRIGAFQRRSPLPRFFAFYTLILTGVYCFIPYKTPWCALGFLHGMAVLAGVGVGAVVEGMARRIAVALRPAPRAAAAEPPPGEWPSRLIRALPWMALLAAAAAPFAYGVRRLTDLSWRTSFQYPAREFNPYCYGHTSPGAMALIANINAIASASADPDRIPMLVVAENYWPLPWYFRRFERVGWLDLDADPSQLIAPILILQYNPLADVNPSPPHPEDYHVFNSSLRYDVQVSVYVRKPLWARYIALRDEGKLK